MKKSYLITINSEKSITCVQPMSRAEYDRTMTMLLEMQEILPVGVELRGYERHGLDFERIHRFELVDDSDNPDNKPGVAWEV